MWDVILDTLFDTVKLIPFLFITYLALEWLEHHTEDKTKDMVKKAGKAGPLFGGLLGAVPQCGFSAAASSLYAGRVISLGTLLAIYLSTSDEMLPIFLASESAGIGLIVKVLAIKVIIGVAAGFLVDGLHMAFVQRGWFHPRKILPDTTERKILEEEPGTEHIRDICEQEKCNCEQGIWKSTFLHTVQISFFILLISFLLNTGLYFLGEDFLAGLFLNKPILGPMIAGVVGLVPNCAASVAITQLYLTGAMSGGAMLSGLLVGAGVGVLVLLRVNHDKKENCKIIALLYGIGVVSGVVFGGLF